MKKILLPTDYSQNADNAIKYALKIFGEKVYPGKIEFVLVHARPMATPAIQPLTTYVPGNEMYGNTKEAEKELKKACIKYHELHPNSAIRSFLLTGSPSIAIPEVAKDENIDMIVMGTQGKGKIEKMIMGETAYQVAQKAPCPVLVVPENMEANPMSKVVFATDFRDLDKKKMLKPLKDLITAFQAELMTLHIYPEKETKFTEKEAINMMLKKYFKTSNYKHFFLEHNHPAEGIAEFINGYRADLLTLIGRERSFFANLFHKSVTKQLLDHTDIPILILHPLHEWRTEAEPKSIRESAKDQIDKLRAEAEDLNVQLYLGKKEAGEEFEKQKNRVKEWASENVEKVNEASKEFSSEVMHKLKSALEKINETASAGVEKTEEGMANQKERLMDAFESLRGRIEEGKKSMKQEITKVSENIEEGLDNLHGRLNMLAVQMNLGKKDSKEELEKRRIKAKAKLEKIKYRIDHYGDQTGDKWEHFKDEMKEAFNHVKKAFVGEDK